MGSVGRGMGSGKVSLFVFICKYVRSGSLMSSCPVSCLKQNAMLSRHVTNCAAYIYPLSVYFVSSCIKIFLCMLYVYLRLLKFFSPSICLAVPDSVDH